MISLLKSLSGNGSHCRRRRRRRPARACERENLLIVMHIFIQKSTSKIVRVYGVKTKVRSFRNGFPVFESVQLDEWGYRGDQYVESD
jgi:hypothetical protein